MKKPNNINELMQEVGYCLRDWSTLEQYLATLFSNVCGFANDRYGQHNDPVRAAFDAVISVDAKLAMLSAAVNSEQELPAEFKTAWAKLKNKVASKNLKRNQVAHFVTSFAQQRDGSPGEALILPFFSVTGIFEGTTPPALTLKQVKERRESFETLRVRVQNLITYIHHKRGMPSEAPLSEDDLSALLENPNAQNPKAP